MWGSRSAVSASTCQPAPWLSERTRTMRTRSKLFISVLAAMLLMSLAASNAPASRLSTSNRNIRAVWALITLTAAGAEITCPVTIEGSFHSATLAKRVGLLVGHISRASVRGGMSECLNTGTASISNLPWHITYGGVQGTLPRPSGLHYSLVDERMTIDAAGILPPCTATSTTANPERGIAELGGDGIVTRLRLDEAAVIPISEGFGCSLFTGQFSGAATVRQLGSTATNIRVSLI